MVATHSNTPAAPLAPPDERFWEKYSPHYEFPLSSFGSLAIHVAAVLVFISALWLLAQLSVSDKTTVPMTELAVAGTGNDVTPPGGGDLVEGVRNERPKERIVPEAKLGDIPAEFKDMVRPKTNGTPGTGPAGGDKAGPIGKGDPTSSGSRGVRWELNFASENGRDYLNQLAAMKATVVVPLPPKWKSGKAFTDLGRDKPTPRDFELGQIPGLYFVDSEPGSVARLVGALGLDFVPPLFIAIFPKEIEEELAAKERAYAGRKEGDVALTRFRVLIRDGKPSVTVIEQVAVKN